MASGKMEMFSENIGCNRHLEKKIILEMFNLKYFCRNAKHIWILDLIRSQGRNYSHSQNSPKEKKYWQLFIQGPIYLRIIYFSFVKEDTLNLWCLLVCWLLFTRFTDHQHQRVIDFREFQSWRGFNLNVI